MRNVIDFDVERDEVSLVCEIADTSCMESCINFMTTAESLAVHFIQGGAMEETVLAVSNGSACYMLPDGAMRTAGEFAVCAAGKTAMRFVVAEEIPAGVDYFLSLSGGIFYVNFSQPSSGGDTGSGSGKDGYSPTVSMTETDAGVQIAITDVNGTKTATVKHGPQGEQGPKGETGDTGPKGETGPAGPQGEKGETGEQGPQGIQGNTGPQGPKGDTGEIGPAGPQGIQGNTGPAGADGFSPTITLTRIANGVQITVVDKNGTQTAIVYDGVGGGGSDSEEATYTFYIDGIGHLICSYTTDEVPPFSIVDGRLIYTYADGTPAPLLEINESGHLILTTEG